MRDLLPFVSGSVAFWSPLIFFRLLLGQNWQIAMIPYTLVAPVLLWVVLRILSSQFQIRRAAAAVMALFGIWATGPFWMDVVNTFTAGEGFHQAGALKTLAWTTLFFPATTFMISTYEAALFALLLTTIVGLLFPVVHRKRKPI